MRSALPAAISRVAGRLRPQLFLLLIFVPLQIFCGIRYKLYKTALCFHREHGLTAGKEKEGTHAVCIAIFRLYAFRSGVYSFSSCSANKAVFVAVTAIEKIAAYFFFLL